MTGADFLITLPEFPDKKVSIKDFGAVENQTDIAGSKRNAAANRLEKCFFMTLGFLKFHIHNCRKANFFTKVI